MNEEAIANFLKARSILAKDSLFTDTHAKCLKNIVDIYLPMGMNNDARPLCFEIKNILEKINKKEHADYATNLDQLGRVHGSAKATLAESFYTQSLQLKKKLFSDTSLPYAATCNNLGGLYTEIGVYDRAIQLQTQARNIRAHILGTNDPAYAQSCNNLAAVYRAVGELEQAESLALEARRIREKLKPERKNPVYAITCTNLANIYRDLGQYKKAESFYIEAKEIRADLSPTREHPDYASGCHILANLYSMTKEFDKAEQLYNEAKKINAKNEDQKAYAENLSSLASLYLDKEDTEKAGSFASEAQQIFTTLLTTGDPDIAIGFNSLGELYFSMGKYEKAQEFFTRATELWKSELGEEHPYYQIGLFNLAKIYWNKNDAAKTKELYTKTFDLQHRQINKIFRFTSEREKQEYIANAVGNADEIYSFYFDHKNFEKSSSTYTISLSNRNLILTSGEQIRQVVNTSGDEALIDRYNQWISLKQQLAKHYSKNSYSSISETTEIEEKANTLEKELAKSSYLKNIAREKPTWQIIQKKLKPGEAAVEFINFQFFNGNRWTDSVYYAALVLKPGMAEPHWVLLTEQKRLDDLVKRLGVVASNINALYGTNEFYKLIWQPLEIILKGTSTIYFAPSGHLHRISMSGLKINKTELLSDKYKLVQLFSTASITTTKPLFISAGDNMVLYGGITYNADSNSLKQAARPYASNHYASRSLPADLNDEELQIWIPLPRTEEEVGSLAGTANEKKINTQVLKAALANEESFKSFNAKQSPVIFHLATHGFFFPDPEKEKRKVYFPGGEPFQKSKNPLFRGGLIFAGGENAWRGKPINGIEDGIVTAYEVSNMYLPNTKLVVLSACETALGDIEGSEGVYGLQRSFKIAGAKTILMSLWNVDDKAGSEFMQAFYKNIFSNNSIDDAFYKAQQELKNKYRNDPYKWAGWIMIR